MLLVCGASYQSAEVREALQPAVEMVARGGSAADRYLRQIEIQIQIPLMPEARTCLRSAATRVAAGGYEVNIYMYIHKY
jgi:hypothetical protein